MVSSIRIKENGADSSINVSLYRDMQELKKQSLTLESYLQTKMDSWSMRLKDMIISNWERSIRI